MWPCPGAPAEVGARGGLVRRARPTGKMHLLAGDSAEAREGGGDMPWLLPTL